MNKDLKTAIVIGSTGLVGIELIIQLIESVNFQKIISLSRQTTGIKHPKFEEHIVNFDNGEEWKAYIKGDVLFSSMGTTIKDAKSKEKQYLVDFTYQYNVAKTAAENGVSRYVLVSSAGANPKSFSFYMKTKGKLEEEVQKLSFDAIHILRPVQLEGEREKKRWTEQIGVKFMKAVNQVGLLRTFRPISGKEVAKAMLRASENPNSTILKLHG